MIRDYPGTVTVKIDAIAASAASVVAMAGDRVMMSPVAMLMIHDPMTIAMGNSKAMEKAISTLNEIKESIVNAYQAKSGLSRNKIAKLMSDETWLNAKKAVELGFADEIMFDDRKSAPRVEPAAQDPDEQDGNDAPEEENDGEAHLKASNAADALEGLLYSTRTMGQTILNSISAFDEGEAPDTRSAQDDGDAEDSETAVTDEEPVPEAVAEEAPEGEAEPVAEDSTAEEAPVSSEQTECPSADGQSEDQTVETADTTEQADAAETTDTTEQADVAETADSVAAENHVAEAATEEDQTAEAADTMDAPAVAGEATPDKTTEGISANILPEGFIAIDKNGRTQDGSVPYIFLKNQLDRMR